MAPECHGRASKIGRGRFFSEIVRQICERDKSVEGKMEDKRNFLLSFNTSTQKFRMEQEIIFDSFLNLDSKCYHIPHF